MGLKNKVTITFERSHDRHVTGYEILATDPKTAIQRRLAVLDNPESPSPIKTKLKLELMQKEYTSSYSKSYRLKHYNIILNQDYGMKIWLNGEILDSSLYVINANDRELVIYVVLKDSDLIEAEYYVDALKYEFTTELAETYTAKPIIDPTNVLIGRHNSLL